MRFLSIFKLFSVVLMILVLIGCEEEEGSGVDFKNYSSDFSIKVQNNTKKRLVAFKITPSASNLIGGIPNTGSNEHGLPKPKGLFTSTGDFTVILVTEDDYIKNKKNLSVLSDAPFATFLAYYNTNSENYVVYPISAHLGGDRIIRIDNNTDLNMELRLDGVHGPILGYAHYGMRNVNLKVEANDYMVFPVFRRYSESMGEIITVYPKYKEGQPGAGKAKLTSFSLRGNRTIEIIEGNKFLGDDIELKTGSAYLTIINNNVGTGLEFRRGGQPIVTSTGGRFINRGGESMTFQINMPKINGSSDQYEEELPIAVGSFTLYGGGESVNIPAYTYKSETRYRLNVTGINAYDIQFPTGIEEIGTIDWKTMF